MTGKTIAKWSTIALLVYAITKFIPDMVRYAKIESM